MAFLTDEEIEKRAVRLRKEMGIDDQEYPHLVTCLFKAKRIGLILGYRRVPTKEMQEEGEFDPDTGILSLREDVFQHANAGVPYARFAVAHELGHVALGHKRKRFRAATTQDRMNVPKVVKGDELQANVFAASFLCPSHLAPLGQDMVAKDVAAQFGVSLKCAELRMDALKRAYRLKNGIKRDLPQSVIDFLASFDGGSQRR